MKFEIVSRSMRWIKLVSRCVMTFNIVSNCIIITGRLIDVHENAVSPIIFQFRLCAKNVRAMSRQQKYADNIIINDKPNDFV